VLAATVLRHWARALKDAVAFAWLKTAGAVMLGKTSVPLIPPTG
jgi:Asp-tRNA(Asn)/Glu-tRNA(Gln) amidotransferase A subunit family amidase